MITDNKFIDDIRTAAACIPDIRKLFDKRILITGASGMVCSAIVEILDYLNKNEQAGITLILAGRSESRLEKRFEHEHIEYEFLKFDATENTSIDLKADYIIHGASNANPRLYATQPVETLLGNIIGTNTILNLARKNENCRVLLISSSEIYGEKNDNNPFKENEYGFVDCLHSRSCYPNGKRAAETLCASYLDEYNVDFTVVRLGHIYGPSITMTDTRATAEFTRNAVNGQNIVMKSSGAQLRSYCYVYDCASAILTVLTSGERGEAYNISNKYSVVTIRRIAELFAQAAGVRVVYENPSDIELKGYNVMPNSSLNSDKLEKLGWKAAFSAEAGVRRTIEILKENSGNE